MSRRWLTPDTIAPTVAHCRRLMIPGDEDTLAIVSGILADLANENNWEQFGAVTPEEAAAAMQAMKDRYEIEVWSMIGAILPCANADIPPGCLACDGAQHNRVDWLDLYAVLSPEFIVDANTFITPDMRGRTAIGTGPGSGLTPRSMNDNGGQENVTLAANELASHDHSTHSHFTSLAVEPGDMVVSIPNPLGEQTGNAGGDQAHENMQPWLALWYVIIAE